MGLFNKQRTDGVTYDGQGEERVGFIDNVFYNLEKGLLLKRHPYDNLSTNAKVTVQEGQEMVFCSEGMFSDVFTPGPHTISTNNVPFLQRIMQIPFGNQSAFKTTLFVVSTTRQRLAGDQGGWGAGDLTIKDYSFGEEGISFKVGSYGSYEFRICDSIAFIKEYSGTQHEIWLDTFTREFSEAVSQRVKKVISQYFSKERIGITEVNNYLDEISDYARRELNAYYAAYGIELTRFDVEGVSPDEDDPNYQKLLAAQADAAQMDLESKALARKRQREGYNYQQERQLDVMQTAAGNEGGAGQMMGVGMGLGMGFGMGGMFGQQMGGIAQQAMQAQPVYGQPMYGQPQYGQAAPPPMPAPMQLYLYLNNQQAGPYDMPALQQYVQQGMLTPQTLVWKVGMPQWAPASSLPELTPLFSPVAPPMPPTPPGPPAPPSV